MRKPTKVLFFILGLVVIGYTGFTFWLLYNFMYLKPGWAEQIGLTEDLFYGGFYATCTFAALTALVGLALIIRALTAKRRDYKLSLATDGGTVQITEDAIESSVRSALADYPGIVESDIKLNLNDKAHHIKARVDCGIREGANLEQYGTSIRDRISRDLAALTGMTVEGVDVTFYEVEADAAYAER